MGAWGLKTFENDDASDWLYDLEESSDLSIIESALNAADTDYLEAPDGCNIVAASEILLGLVGTIRLGLPDNASDWIRKNTALDASHLKDKAISALSIVLSENSELKELWQESEEDYEEWVSDVKNLQSALASS